MILPEIFMSGDGLLGLRFFTGDIVDGRLAPYVALPGDTVVEDGRLFRDDVELGKVVGPGGAWLFGVDTFDPGPFAGLFTRTNDAAIASDAIIDQMAGWTVTVNGVEVDITDLYRKSKIVESANTEGFQKGYVQEHVIHLDIGRTIADGDVVSITSPGGMFDRATATIDTTATRSEAVHVNQNGFRPDDPSKIAVLSTWLGVDTDRAENEQFRQNGVEYTPGTPFHIVDTATGLRVFDGEIALLLAADRPNTYPNGGRTPTNLTYADTWVMDFSAFDTPGTYVVEVEGIGTSYDFRIADDTWTDAFVIGMRGFYHQRSGIALEQPHTDWVRPASLVPTEAAPVIQSSVTILQTANSFIPGRTEDFTFQQLEQNATGVVLPDAWGGWHDAGDWDRRPQHLAASNQMMELVETNRGFFEGIDLNIPESGNGVPDVLDEALWNLDFFQRLQADDGGVRGGVEGGLTFQGGEASWANSRPLYAYAPDPWSSMLFAGSAGRAARVVEPYDVARAAQYLDDAVAAFDWALANWITPVIDEAAGMLYDQNLIDARNLAALELFRTTGDTRFMDDFLTTSSFATDAPVKYWEHQSDAAYAYLSMDADLQDAAVAARMLADFTALADTVLLNWGLESGFGTADNPFAPYLFSATATNPDWAADVLVRAHALTGDDRYLIGAIMDANFALGLNPDNLSYVSGFGDEQMREMLVGDAEALGGILPPGLVAYGTFDAVGNGVQYWHAGAEAVGYPQNPLNWPGYESWQGLFDAVPLTEFTVEDPMGSSVYLWGYLAQIGQGQTAPGLGAFSEYTVQLGTVATLIDGMGRTARQVAVGDSATFEDGVIGTVRARGAGVSFVAVDPLDAYPWERLVMIGDFGDAAWSRQTRTLDATGALLTRAVIFDDGRTSDTAYVDGNRTTTTQRDPTDVRSWTSVTTEFAGGERTARHRLDDNGVDTIMGFVAGTIATSDSTDTADAFVWSTVRRSFDDAGSIVTRVTDFDNGDISTTTYADGVRRSVLFEDVSDSRPWTTRLSTYGSDGELENTTFL